MAFKKPVVPTSAPESPDRLFRDLPRRKHASLYDHQGQILRTYVAQAMSASDVALQLPTGSGKTLVGLLLAEWRRRKNQERVVYLCPTRQLVNQVADEASSKYGLTVEAFTGQIKNYTPAAKAAYENSDRVAVTTYSSLFNVNPYFDSPDIIVVDDAHAAENYIATQWTVRISRLKPEDKLLHAAVVAVLKGVMTEAAYGRMTGEPHSQDEDGVWVDKIPSPTAAGIADELRDVINENVGEGEQRYAWRMIRDHLVGCHIYVSSYEILLRPLIPPTWDHPPFANAKQRIFMSATLGGGGDLERLTGRSRILRLPIPEGWDRQGIGRRFFVFPEKSLKDADITTLRRSLMKAAGRSLVITPNNDDAEEVTADVKDNLGYRVFSGADLEDQKAVFVATSPAVAVVANRYDGIDLPDDDCRLLFVEGLPRAVNLQERFLMNRMGAHVLLNERVQTRVLQAVGRCTRGLNDYSAVVVTGEDLPGYLTDRRRRSHFHPELQAELEFGIEQSTGVSAEDILANFGIFIEHDTDWEDANQGILDARGRATQIVFPAMKELADSVRFEIEWQKAMWAADYAKAFDATRDVLGKLNDPELRGYRVLWHYLAGSSASFAVADGDTSLEGAAKTHFKQAKEASAGISWLSALARADGSAPTPDERAHATLMLQVERLEIQLRKLGTVHNRSFSAREKNIRDGLSGSASFEQSQVLLGEHLGYEAGKKEEDGSPDPWWRIGDTVIVFEDHAGATDGAVLDATKARQAASHPDWVKQNVPDTAGATIYSVLVTPATKAKKGAMPHLSRVSYWALADFRKWAEAVLVAIRDLRRSFVEPGDLAWRADAARKLMEIRADAPGLVNWLSLHPADKHMKEG